jgi:hypothetical protein
LTVKAHDPPPARLEPDKVMTPVPGVAVIVPPQVNDTPFGVATIKPAGNVSVNATPVSDVVMFGLLRLKVSVVDAFNGTEAAPNAFERVGGAATVMLAFEVFPVPAFVEVT